MINRILIFFAGATSNTGTDFDRIGMWTFLLALATIALVVATLFLWRVSKEQLGGINKINKADFIKRFSKDFFTESTRDIIMLLNFEALSYRIGLIDYGKDVPQKNFPYFLINEEIVKQLKIDSRKIKKLLEKKVYSSFEIDDLLLGFFEDIGAFEKQGLLDIEDVYNHFDWYIEEIWNNKEIKKYIKQQRIDEDEGDDIYENFERVYNKCSVYKQ